MTDEQLLDHCLNALRGEYGEIANALLVEALQKRLGLPRTGEEPLSPADRRKRINAPWDDKASY